MELRPLRVARCVGCACALACAVTPSNAQSVRTAAVGARRSAPTAVSMRALPPLRPSFATTTPDATNPNKPEIEPARVIGEVFAGAYAGLGGYFLGSWAGGWIGDALPSASEGTRDQISFVTGIAGATFATAASVSAIGNIGDQTGSYSAALTGTVVGVGAGLLLNQLLYGHARLPSESESSRMRWIEASLEAMLPSLGATIGFNSTRKYK